MSLMVRRLSHALGAEITGIDFSKPLDDETFAQVHSAFLEHQLLLFRGQGVTKRQFLDLSRRFGELKPDASVGDRDTEFPEILINTNRPRAGAKALGYGAMIWHIDQMSTYAPAMATLVRGVEVPRVGGDTMFANLCMAYDTLSDGMKNVIAPLQGVYPGITRVLDDSTPERLEETRRQSYPVAQPLVRVHPETGRKALFIGEKVKKLVDMSEEESRPLIDFLCKHATRPQFVYRHEWQKDDIVLWDNRCLVHIAVYDFDKGEMRYMEKTSVRGNTTGRLYDGPM